MQLFPVLLCLTLCSLITAGEVPTSAAEASPVAVGSQAPLAARLSRPDGTATTLGEALDGKPTMVIFYRGGWCPFCVRQLAGLSDILPALRAAGWNPIALAPDQPSVLAKSLVDGDGGVARFSDAEGHAMRAFGVAFRVDDATHTALLGYGVDLAKTAGNEARLLPVPAVFLIDAAGAIRFVHADPDYRVRLDAHVLLATARRLAEQP